MPSTLGGTTVTVFRNHESHKLHLEFIASVAVVEGQPCKLLADGKVAPWVAGDATIPIIGWATMSAAVNAGVTLAVRGYLVIESVIAAATPAGLGKYSTQTVDVEGHSVATVVAAADIATMHGWVLVPTTTAFAKTLFLAMN